MVWPDMWKKFFGIIASGLWESLFGCLMPLLSSPSLGMTVSSKILCDKHAALAPLQKRESVWGKSLAMGEDRREPFHSNSFEA